MKLKQHDLPRILLVIALATAAVATAYSFSSYLSSFRSTYPTTTYPNAAALNTCLLCHTGYPYRFAKRKETSIPMEMPMQIPVIRP